MIRNIVALAFLDRLSHKQMQPVETLGGTAQKIPKQLNRGSLSVPSLDQATKIHGQAAAGRMYRPAVATFLLLGLVNAAAAPGSTTKGSFACFFLSFFLLPVFFLSLFLLEQSGTMNKGTETNFIKGKTVDFT